MCPSLPGIRCQHVTFSSYSCPCELEPLCLLLSKWRGRSWELLSTPQPLRKLETYIRFWSQFFFHSYKSVRTSFPAPLGNIRPGVNGALAWVQALPYWTGFGSRSEIVWVLPQVFLQHDTIWLYGCHMDPRPACVHYWGANTVVGTAEPQ